MSDYTSTPKEFERLNDMISLGKHLVNEFGFNQLDFLVTKNLVKFKLSVLSKLTPEIRIYIESKGFEIAGML